MNTTDARAVADPEAVRAAAAEAALFRQQQAVTTQDGRAFAATFASTPRARDLAEEIFANLTRMPLSSYSLRYVGEVSGGPHGLRVGHGAGVGRVHATRLRAAARSR
jgi:hypothetical protein